MNPILCQFLRVTHIWASKDRNGSLGMTGWGQEGNANRLSPHEGSWPLPALRVVATPVNSSTWIRIRVPAGSVILQMHSKGPYSWV